MKKIPLLTAAAVGYVLGARAGRERYEQIRSQARRVAGDPRVRSARDKATDAVSSQAASAAEVAKEKVTDAAHTVADKARRESSVQPAP